MSQDHPPGCAKAIGTRESEFTLTRLRDKTSRFPRSSLERDPRKSVERYSVIFREVFNSTLLRFQSLFLLSPGVAFRRAAWRCRCLLIRLGLCPLFPAAFWEGKRPAVPRCRARLSINHGRPKSQSRMRTPIPSSKSNFKNTPAAPSVAILSAPSCNRVSANWPCVWPTAPLAMVLRLGPDRQNHGPQQKLLAALPDLVARRTDAPAHGTTARPRAWSSPPPATQRVLGPGDRFSGLHLRQGRHPFPGGLGALARRHPHADASDALDPPAGPQTPDGRTGQFHHAHESTLHQK